MEHLKIYENVLKEVVLATNSRAELLQAVQHHPNSPYKDQHQHPVTDHIDAVRKNVAEVNAVIEEILKSDLTAGQRAQMEKYVAERSKYVNEGLNAACDAILAGDYEKANQILLEKAIPLSMSTVREAETFGQMGMADQAMHALSLVFGVGMMAVAVWVVWVSLG